MNLSQALFLSLIQGITEFLPISSSGHLVFFQNLLKIKSSPVFFDIFVHLATLFAVLFYFRHHLVPFFKNKDNLLLIFIGTLPAAFFGLLLKPCLDSIFNSLGLLSFFWFLNGLFLFSSQFFKKTNLKPISEINLSDISIIGFFQALALFPGFSRSGSTITAGLARQLSPESSLQISFFLAVPAVIGAIILELLDLPTDFPPFSLLLISFLLAALSGFFSLFLLEKTLKKGKFYLFGFYCFILSGVSLVFSLVFN